MRCSHLSMYSPTRWLPAMVWKRALSRIRWITLYRLYLRRSASRCLTNSSAFLFSPCVTVSFPVRQSREPAMYFLRLVPGVTTFAWRPRRIHMQPILGLRFTSTSSWNKATSSSGSASSSWYSPRRIFFLFGSFGPGTGLGRRHTTFALASHRRTVSRLTLTPCTLPSTSASASQLQRLRARPYTDGGTFSTNRTTSFSHIPHGP